MARPLGADRKLAAGVAERARGAVELVGDGAGRWWSLLADLLDRVLDGLDDAASAAASAPARWLAR
jgi:hypothetical protein